MSDLVFCRICSVNLDSDSEKYFDLDSEVEIYEEVKIQLSLLNLVCDFSDHKHYAKTVCLVCCESLNTASEFIYKTKLAQSKISKLLSNANKDIEDDLDSTHNIVADEDIGKDFDGDITEEITVNTWSNYQWLCSLCSKVFEDASQLRNHSLQEHGLCCAFNCADCTETFLSYKNFTEHGRKHRPDLRNCCIYCNELMENIQDCTDHENRHEENCNLCSKCGCIFLDDDPISIMYKHKNYTLVANKDNAKVKKKISRCISSDSLSSLSYDEDETLGHPIPPKQIQIATWDDYPWICRICDVAFNTIDLLRLHLKTQHGRCTALKCLDCKHYFLHPHFDMFLRHVGNHRRNLCKVCFYCRQELSTINELHKHVHENHLKGAIYCKKCGETFQSEQEHQIHMEIYVLPKNKETHTPKLKENTCKLCKKVYKSEYYLKRHTAITHLKKINYTCDECGLTFFEKSELAKHKSIEHEKLRFKCKICRRGFKHKSSLKKHVQCHSSEKPYSCKVCEKSFKLKSLLKNHETIHLKIKPFTCQECGKSFRLKEFLKRHEIIHTGLKPYSCKVCNVAYANRENCYHHMKMKHNMRSSTKNLEVEFDVDVKEWHSRVFSKRRRGREPREDLS